MNQSLISVFLENDMIVMHPCGHNEPTESDL